MKLTIQDKVTANRISPKELVEKLLTLRKIENRDEFLNPPDPQSFSLKDFGFTPEQIKTLIDTLTDIKKANRTIVVYTDYDADGITGGAIMWETLNMLGFTVMPYVPHRKLEGYGFSTIGIDRVKADYDPALIISVDHGITAIEQIKYAKSLGIDVIVTDHHHKQEQIPEAAKAIFHIPALSGSGAAYYVAKEIAMHFIEESKYKVRLRNNFKTDYLALASIGTVADLVPLVGPSRSVVAHGLKRFASVKRIGITQICKEAKIDNKPITPYEIGFVIAPRINAVGRLEHAIDALRLLCTTNEDKAHSLASKVGRKNIERQDLVKVSVEQALKQVEEIKKKEGALPKLLILHSADWHEGIIGLIASKLVEKYYRPVIVMSEADGQLKASARSIPAFHITNFFMTVKKYFLNFGGHGQAAGFSMAKAKLAEFTKIAQKLVAKQLTDAEMERIVEADLELPVGILSLAHARALDELSPFGIGNPVPTFVSSVEIYGAAVFGKTGDHLKVTVKDPDEHSFPLELIAFGKAELFTTLAKGDRRQIVYQLEINRYNGKETLRGRLLQII